MRMKELAENFGTGKSKKQFRYRELMQVEGYSEPIGDNVINKEALNSANVHDVRNIPPHNTSATTPQEAYPLDKIILMGEWDYLEGVHEVLRLGSEVAIGAYPTFVRHRIHRLQDIKN